METRIWTNGSIYILDIQGDIHYVDSNRLKDMVMKMIGKKVECLIINASRIKSIDSSGIGAFIYISSTLKKLGMSLAIANVSAALGQVMDKTKLVSYFPIYKNINEAVEKFSQEQ